jgi:hypothetical protein
MKTMKVFCYFISLGTAVVLITGDVLAQQMPTHQMTHEKNTGSQMHDMGHGAKDAQSDHHTSQSKMSNPTLPGQDAFGAIQEILTILDADSNTDWSKVNISKLRSHLVDMNRLVMDTKVSTKVIEGGLELTVTGPVQSIQAMVPAHAPMIDGLNDWIAKGKKIDNGAKLTVTATSAKEIAHIRALGFYGLMVSGSHHQTHHLGLARGENVHTQ